MGDGTSGVRAEYEKRLGDRAARAREATARARQLSHARLAVFVAGLAGLWLVFGPVDLAGSWLAAPAGVFVALVIAHDRALGRQRGAERAVAYYEDGVARLDYTFAGRGNPGERFLDVHHAYAPDLDLFGSGSLFELLCRARTRGGEALLASWLLAPAPLDEIPERQRAVAELRGSSDLRERLALVGEEVAAGLHPEALIAWASAAPPAPATSLRLLAAVFGAVSGGLAVAVVLGVPLIPLLFWGALQTGFALSLRRRVRACIAGLDRPLRDLELLADLLAVIEAEEWTTPRLVRLQGALATEGLPASVRIRRLRRMADLLDARRNQIFAPFAALLLFTTQVALAVDAWRAHLGPLLPAWLDAVAELEALASLATQAFEHPEDCVPDISATGPIFVAAGAGHPLLPDDVCVRNDVRLDASQPVLLVSGSNMSGKSTLLRTVGTNAVLALAGATVRARELRVSPLVLGASIRIVDSLQEGSSKFYAEITRLKQIVELCDGERPVLFLLDEILHGTNSHDRLIGAEAVVRTLAARGAIGLVTTHDLALTRVAESLEPPGRNVHFQDHLEDGRMRFDYHMHPGVVTRSNALELMRSVGLEV